MMWALFHCLQSAIISAEKIKGAKGMMLAKNYPHMNDTSYPDLQGVDVWKFKNDYDYSQFDSIQMRITVCTVPWDVGVIHVGNAQIPSLGNVVDFGSETERDRWFDSLTDKFVFDTEYRKFHMEGKAGAVDGTIKLPIPYDVISRYNYAVVEYTPMPVHLEGQGVKRWHYFIRECFMKAPNTTEVELILDAWQTFIYGVDIPYMMLERGHAPLAALSADAYLSNPMDNTRFVAGDDVSYDNHPSIVRSENNIVFNDGDNVYACIVLDSALGNSWGTHHTNSWKMPVTHRLTNQGTPNYMCVAMAAAAFNDFLVSVDDDFPQFKQAVQAVFFATDKMISLGDSLTMGGYSFNYVQATQRETELLDLTKASFGFDAKYADIAKLYTYPYSHIEIMDENGSVSVIRVEDTRGQLDIATNLSTVFPFINLTANVLGVGSSSERNITFKNFGTRSMRFGGKWQDVQLDWDVPTFAVVQSNGITNDYATHFDRQQMKLAADNAYDSALASNETSNTNALASALAAYNNALASNETENTNALASNATSNTNALAVNQANYDNSIASNATLKTNVDIDAAAQKTVADRSADTSVINCATQVSANENTTSTANVGNTSTTSETNGGITATNTIANQVTIQTVNNEIDAAYDSAAISAVGDIAGGAVNGALGGMSGGPTGAITGAIQGLIGGAINTALNYAQLAVSTNLKTSQAELVVYENNAKATSSKSVNTAQAGIANDVRLVTTRTMNNAMTATTAASAATQKNNASTVQGAANTTSANTKTTDDANAARTKTTLDASANRTKETDDANANRTKATGDANALRTKNAADANANRTKSTGDANAGRARNTAYNQIDNQIRQAGLEPSNTFGSIANAETATTRPMAVFAQVVTQNDGAIASAGDEMLRFGYHCNLEWNFNGWRKMKHFTYWKLKDLWISDFRLPDAYADLLRYTLMGGVTVWNDPGKIGKVSIYDNL